MITHQLRHLTDRIIIEFQPMQNLICQLTALLWMSLKMRNSICIHRLPIRLAYIMEQHRQT